MVSIVPGSAAYTQAVVLSLADVLDLPVVRRARPRVVVGADRLDTPVRWAHVAEVTDLAHLLRGGELVLTTGIALPDAAAALRRYVTDLAEAGDSGIAVELGRKYRRRLPDALVDAAREAGVPVICLERETRFVEITEAVHSRVLTEQLEELRASERMHTVFTELSLEGAPRDRVLREVARLSGCPVVVENTPTRCWPTTSTARTRWCSRPGEPVRSVASTRRTFRPGDRLAGHHGGARGQDWGQLILVCGASPPRRRPHWWSRRRPRSRWAVCWNGSRRAWNAKRSHDHRGDIDHLSDPEEALVRARAVGVPWPAPWWSWCCGSATRVPGSPRRPGSPAENVARCAGLRLSALVGSLGDRA